MRHAERGQSGRQLANKVASALLMPTARSSVRRWSRLTTPSSRWDKAAGRRAGHGLGGQVATGRSRRLSLRRQQRFGRDLAPSSAG